MKYFIDNVINLMYQFTTENTDTEMKEQESAPSAGSSGGAGSAPSSPTVPKWSEVVGGPKRGKANMLGADGEVWSTGLNRGVANQLW